MLDFAKRLNNESTHLSLAASQCDVDKSACICYSLLGATLGGLLLFLGLHLENSYQHLFSIVLEIYESIKTGYTITFEV